jgi:hypothetical protein
MRHLLILLSVLAVIACEPEHRDYSAPPEPDPIEGAARFPDAPAVIASGAPAAQEQPAPPDAPAASCTCEPTPADEQIFSCYGLPIVSGGLSGCEPTLGGDTFGSASIRVPGGETITGYIAGDWIFFAEGYSDTSIFTHRGVTMAKSLYTSASPRWTSDVDLSPQHLIPYSMQLSTVRLDASAGPVTVVLPSAAYHAGHRLSFKVVAGVGAEAGAILGAMNPWSGSVEKVDTATGVYLGPGGHVTLEGALDDPSGIGAHWIVVGG